MLFRSRWMLPPPGWTLTTCECDPRQGGALSLIVSDDGQGREPAVTGRSALAVHRLIDAMVMSQGRPLKLD